jgi:hypothetical protein
MGNPWEFAGKQELHTPSLKSNFKSCCNFYSCIGTISWSIVHVAKACSFLSFPRLTAWFSIFRLFPSAVRDAVILCPISTSRFDNSHWLTKSMGIPTQF